MTINLAIIALWILRIIAAVIMLQTLFFKFSGSDESIYIFSSIGMEPWGRIGSGVLELIASVLILYPKTTFLGAALAMALMSGAIWFHLTKLGIEVQNDGGLLFFYALAVHICSSILLFVYRQDMIGFFRHLLHKIS
jgi:uncharacterized membrane protein YphA (DoxX/SURF4 family)